jgi:hypothetical protein
VSRTETDVAYESTAEPIRLGYPFNFRLAAGEGSPAVFGPPRHLPRRQLRQD